MHDIFVSYQHEDRPHAAALAVACEDRGLRVWWDRKIRAGDYWDEEIEQALDRARAVVLLWSKHARASAWVRAEAEEAARRRNLIPTLLDDHALPLRLRQMQSIDLREWRRAHEPHEIAALLAALDERLESPAVDLDARDAERWRARMRQVRRRVRIARTALVVTFLTFLLQAAGAFDGFLGWDMRMRLLSIDSRSVLASGPRDEITAVISPSAGSEWRRRTSVALDQLSRAGARVVFFGFSLPAPRDGEASKTGTADLAATIRAARARGTAVIVPAVGMRGDRPNVDAPILEALERRGDGLAPGGWGTDCVGGRDGFASVLPLVIAPADSPSDDLIPSLALRTRDAFEGRDGRYRRRDHEIIDVASPDLRAIPYARWRRIARDQRCRIMRADTWSAQLYIDLGRTGTAPWARGLAFDDVERGRFEPEAVRDRIVLIGIDTPPEHKIWRGGQRHVRGLDLHAAALATVMDGAALRSLGTVSQLAVLFAFSSAAAALRLGWATRPIRARAGLPVLLGAALALTFALAVGPGILMDGTYVLAAILLAHALTGWIREAP